LFADIRPRPAIKVGISKNLLFPGKRQGHLAFLSHSTVRFFVRRIEPDQLIPFALPGKRGNATCDAIVTPWPNLHVSSITDKPTDESRQLADWTGLLRRTACFFKTILSICAELAVNTPARRR
jgi:hypothetical protein